MAKPPECKCNSNHASVTSNLTLLLAVHPGAAVLLHELPHEVGDVAILIAAGYRPTQAVKMQFMTAIGAMTGTLVGLLSGSYFKGLADVRHNSRQQHSTSIYLTYDACTGNWADNSWWLCLRGPSYCVAVAARGTRTVAECLGTVSNCGWRSTHGHGLLLRITMLPSLLEEPELWQSVWDKV